MKLNGLGCALYARPYRQESYFAYLFGVTEPDFYGALVRDSRCQRRAGANRLPLAPLCSQSVVVPRLELARPRAFPLWLALGPMTRRECGAVCNPWQDLATGQSMLFIPRLPESYAVWMGSLLTPQDFKVDQAPLAVTP